MRRGAKSPGAAQPATASDVARLAGVSQSAVSRTFTPGASVAEKTRAVITDAARQLGYRPNAIARSLITRRSRIIGVVAAHLQNHFYPDVLERLSMRLRGLGYHILLFTADPGEPADAVLEEIIRYRVDGLILASITLSSELAEECQAAGIPVLLFNRTTKSGAMSSVTGENRRGGEVIAEFLTACGHQRLAFVAGAENSSTSQQREAGFLGRLARLGDKDVQRAVGHYSFEGAAAAARTLLAGPGRPDAVFCANDLMAFAFADVARYEFGLSIPGDVALVGFDDTSTASWPSFSLTSFSQPAAAMVDRAAEMIMRCIEKPETAVRRETVPGDLILRGSTRDPGGAVERDGKRIWLPPGESR